MHQLAWHPVTRAVLHAAARGLRPFRFWLGLSRPVKRPLERLLEL